MMKFKSQWYEYTYIDPFICVDMGQLKWETPQTLYNLFFMFILGRFNYLTLTDPKKVWMPDTFFRNEKVGHFHAILVNNAYVRVFPGGDVLYSIR